MPRFLLPHYYLTVPALLLATATPVLANSITWSSDHSDQIFTVGEAVNLTLPTVTATGSCTGSLTHSLYYDPGDGLQYWRPAGLTFNLGTGVLSGTPTTARTADTVTHTVTDQSCYKHVSRTFSVSITNVSLTASNVTNNSATLTVGNHSGAWYYKYSSPTGGSCSSVVSSGTTTANLTSLTSGTSYTYKAYSDSTCTTPLADADVLTKPGQVAGVGATAGDTSLSVSWTALTGTVTGYKVQWKSGQQNYNTGNRQKTVTSGTSTSITGLTNDTTYTVRVTAYNGTGDGAASAEVNGTPATETLTASAVTATTATLTLTSHSGAWYYKYSSPTGGSCSSVVSSGTTTANLTSLTTGTSYTYKAYSDSSCNTELTSATTDADFLTKPGQVAGVGVTADDASLSVSWTALTGTVTGYKVQWKSGLQNYNTGNRQKTVTSGTSTSITGLTNDTTYTVRVTAYNGTGDGAASAEVNGTPVTETLTASAVTATTATLTLTNHSGAWYYKYSSPTGGSCSSVVSSGTTTANLTSLTTGTTYTYKAYSDSSCSTELTSAATDADFLTKPGQVAGVGTTAGDTSLSVSWTALTGTVTGYKVQWKSGQQNYNNTGDRQKTVTSGTSTSITGLTNDTTYTVRVTAYNGTGDGAASAEVNGTPSNTTLTASAVTATTATLTLANHSGAWYYKYSSPTGGSCSSVVSSGTTTANLTSLAAGTTYTYKAYSDSSCSTELTSAATDAEFSTVGLTATSVTSSGATLTLANWTAAWWYKGNQTNASCTAVAANTTTASLTGLTGGTSYAYTVYSAAGCNATNEIADVEFATTGLSVNITGVPATTGSVFTATFTFSAAVTGFDITDIKLGNATSANFAGSGTTYTADITPTGQSRRRPGRPRGPSVYSVWVAANAAVDSNNVGNGAAIRRRGTYDASPTLACEGVPATNNGTPFTVKFSFSEAVTGFEASDISLTGATMTNFTGSGASYSAVVTATADYTISVAAGAAQDSTGNLTPADSCSGTFDTTAPTVTITGVPAAANGAFTATFTFSEPVTGFATTDTIDATVTGATVSEIKPVGGDGSAYSATITPSGDYAVSVAANVAQDTAGNGNTAAAAVSGVYDTTAPTVAITGVPATTSAAFTATFTFSESVTGFEVGDITLSNASAADFSGSAATYTALVTPNSAGAYSVSVPAAAAQDTATNGNTASTTASGTASSLVCSRTVEVRNAIVAAVSGKTTCSAITDTDLAGISSLTVADNTTLTALQSGDFAGLTALTTLDLSGNSLSSLPANVFDDLTALTTLDLEDNDLTALPANVFDDLTALTTLDLDDNDLTALPANVFDDLTALTTLDLGDNDLTALPVNVFDDLTVLTNLDLINNDLTALPVNVFDNLTALRNLDLSGNSLTSLRANVFDNLTELDYLALYENSLTVLPAGVFDNLTKLKSGLDLGKNSLSSNTLPAGVFDNLTKLEKLYIGGNSGLATLPAGIFDKLSSLTTLFAIGSPKLTCLPFIPNDLSPVVTIAPGSAACGAAVTVGATGVTVGAGQTATYTVVLDAYPRGNVTVTPESGATGKATVSGALTFTQDNWSTAQSVTVTGVAAGSATVSHTVRSGGYDNATAGNVAATVTAASLAVSAVTSTTATLTIANHSSDWYYKYTTPSGGTCSSVVSAGTTTAIASSLADSTSYTFKAYSDNGCTTELATAAATSTLAAVTLTASDATVNSLKLIAHSGYCQ